MLPPSCSNSYLRLALPAALVATLISACSPKPGDHASKDAPSSIDQYDQLEKAAYLGDYQAQRNLAYTLTTGIPRNNILGCAWRIVIVQSGSEQVDQSDTGNKRIDCDQKLSPDEVLAAQAQAKTIQARIAKKQ
jgi:hypothetical protein